MCWQSWYSSDILGSGLLKALDITRREFEYNLSVGVMSHIHQGSNGGPVVPHGLQAFKFFNRKSGLKKSSHLIVL